MVGGVGLICVFDLVVRMTRGIGASLMVGPASWSRIPEILIAIV